MQTAIVAIVLALAGAYLAFKFIFSAKKTGCDSCCGCSCSAKQRGLSKSGSPKPGSPNLTKAACCLVKSGNIQDLRKTD